MTQINPEVYSETRQLIAPNVPQVFNFPAGKKVLDYAVVVESNGFVIKLDQNSAQYMGTVTPGLGNLTVTTPFVGEVRVTVVTTQ